MSVPKNENKERNPQPKESDASSEAVGSGSRTEPLPVVRGASVDDIQNDGYLHQVPGVGAREYLQPVQGQEAPGGVSQNSNYMVMAQLFVLMFYMC